MGAMKRFFAILLLIGLLAGCANNDEGGTELRDAEAAALYETAKSAMDRGDWATATEELEALQAQYPFGIYATQGQLDLIYTYYRANDPTSAVAAAERFRRINPRHREVPYTWYMQGLALQEKNEDAIKRWVGVDTTLRDPVPRRQAFQAYRTLIEQYPDSEYVDDARERIDELYMAGARYQLSVARFYADRQAWVAAARRAIGIINEFPESPTVDPAMTLLEQAYRALELPDLAEGVIDARDEALAQTDEKATPDAPPLYQDETREVAPSPEAGSAPSGGSAGGQLPMPPSTGGGMGEF
ncbi:putative lipoprotein [Spiribacter salinus M19-40]|uniref:Outer membrane protein assembly factor BamD n=2 Tax=Spiribacter salinus TaxID=1335746 RepID=R4V605_9GAMM|nr:putative lipoprotein [Spiribacter salinus M19-40]